MSWEEFPLAQKFFAVGETVAHLDYLRLRGKVVRETVKRVQQMTITGTTANTMSVSHTFMPARMMNEITPFSPAMKNSSGQWWALLLTSTATHYPTGSLR